VVFIKKYFCILVGGYKKFENSFENSQKNPGNIALSFYSGIYSYAGWNYLNFMTEELQNPHRCENIKSLIERFDLKNKIILGISP